MVEEVVWLKRAITNFDSIIVYLKTEWSPKTAEDFYEKLTMVIELLCEYPYAGAPSEIRKNARQFLITRHNYVLYKIVKKKLMILNIIDTRRES